jgi:hypothetical protein
MSPRKATSRSGQTSVASRKERVDERLQRYVGKKKVSFYYKHPDGRSETVASAPIGDRAEIARAQRVAKRYALDLYLGRVVAGSMAEIIERFRDEVDPTHFRDQSKDGKAVRNSRYEQLVATFGRMKPIAMEMFHGYQHMDGRAKEGAPAGANKEMALMQTICNHAVRWGVLKVNPFLGLMLNVTEREIREVGRSQVVQFYLWSVRQQTAYRTMGCAAMFAYLTGFRAAEVRPFHISGLRADGVQVASAKRKRGEAKVMKLRAWSTRLRTVVQRAQTGRPAKTLYLFANGNGGPYTRSGWGSVWLDAMYAWIGAQDPEIARESIARKAREAAKRKGNVVGDAAPNLITKHPLYFALNDGRPTAITAKMERRDEDVYDFAAHANPATTHKSYDRRRVRKAAATE